MFRCCAFCALILICPALTASAQNPAPPSTQATPSATPNTYDDAAYRKLAEFLSWTQKRNAKDYAITSPKGIDEETYVPIGGIEQWVVIRGEDRNNPVLLFLHGGPGDVTTPWSYPYFAAWEQHFTVAQWDQRGAGKTLAKSGPSIGPTMTRERMAQDGIELTDYLCKHLGKRKIIVVGHSWGTVLGLRMVQQRPDLYLAYVGTGQVSDETANYAVAYEALLKKARDTGNQEALDQLKGIGPPPYTSGQSYQVQRKWSNRFEGADRFLPATIGLGLQAPKSSVRDLDDSLEGELFSGEHLVRTTKPATMKDFGLQFTVPMFFFEGTEDFTTPTELARKYLDALQAPRKEFVSIPGGHFAVFINSDEFLKQLIVHVAPLAAKR
jgi:pimeloyl-ACP methyl ester carboxylesterase